MIKFSLPRIALAVLLCAALANSALAQIYSAPAPAASPAPAPAPAASPAPAPATSPAPTSPAPSSGTTSTTGTEPATPAVTTTTTSTGTATTSTVTTGTVPGYNAGKSYSSGKTVAYVIAPFAAVAGTYFLTHHHQVEINPYGGFFWAGKGGNLHLRDEGVYGLKALASLTDNIQVEGNFGYINHLEGRFAPTMLDQTFGIRPTTVHGLIYDINGLYNFGEKPLFGSGVSPYVVAGIGGISTLLENGSAALIGGQIYTTDAAGNLAFDPGRKIIVADNSAFFSVNYGVGFKAMKLWGPMGARVDIRGRTFPNFRGETVTWPEATAGLVFTFGEK